ncbi:3-ketosteroid-delta-1-dehydrogenase, partial [Mycobacterium sp. ITM-2017-0098]
SLSARLRLAMKQQDIPLWLNSPMTELITDTDGPDGRVVGAVIGKDGRAVRVQARRGVVLASGGFDHDMAWRLQHLPELSRVHELA